jgi:hypothetical protein
MWTLPLRRDSVGHYGYPRDHGGNTAGETSGCEAPGIHR